MSKDPLPQRLAFSRHIRITKKTKLIVFVIASSSTRWGWRFETGVVQKVFLTKEEAIFYGKQAAKQHGSEVYVEGKNGKFKNLSEKE